jgi:negative regulator of flagellin synthesis FlgM
MAIDIINTKPIGPSPSNKPSNNATVNTKSKIAVETTTVAQDDSVVITSTAQNIQNSSSANSSAPVNEQRIQQLMAALQDGSYKINPERIAGKMLDFDLNLPDTP